MYVHVWQNIKTYGQVSFELWKAEVLQYFLLWAGLSDELPSNGLTNLAPK